MVFSSMAFLCIFLPLVFLVYTILPGIRAKNAILLIASLLFYAYGEPVYVLLMIVSALINYISALLISRLSVKKTVLACCVILNLSLLIVFKYAGFLTETCNELLHLSVPVPQIRLPIGISFFTFQAMSYVIDVYRSVTGTCLNPEETVQADSSFPRVLLYISFFPQLIAGPIVKYHDIAADIRSRNSDPAGIHKGIRRFITGLCKKVLIANTMGLAADTLFAVSKDELGILAAWIGALSYLFQIYFDFSGYSDMAIGMGWMFGFRFRENFNYPYISSGIREFWRRWHISLSSWFRDYLYIPLGGNRKGRIRKVRNQFIVFLCTGIWHGANLTFLFWGLYHGCFLMLEEYVPFFRNEGSKIKKFVLHIYCILVVMIGFVFFRSDTISQGFSWVAAMFTPGIVPAKDYIAMSVMTPLYLFTFLLAAVFSCPVLEALRSRLGGRRGYELAADLLSLGGLILCILSLAGGTYNPFIYFRF